MSKIPKDENRYKKGLVPLYWVAGIIAFITFTLLGFSYLVG
ncbi:MAG: hypothetical protein V3R64_08250 [Sphingomonadales bacterium]